MHNICCLSSIGDILDKIQEGVISVCQTEAKSNSTLLLGIFIGAILFKLFDSWVAQRKVDKAYRMTLDTKDELIEGYKLIISDRIEKIQVDEHSKPIMKKVRDFFKAKVKKKRKK